MARCLGGRQVTDAELLRRLLAGACEIDERLLEALLAEGVPAPLAVRRAVHGRLHTGVALLLGGALALGAAGPVAAREGAAPAAAPVALAALAGSAAVVAPPAAAPAAVEAAAPASLAEVDLAPGLVLLVPGLAVEAQQGTTPIGQLYTVVSGDTLSGIALRFYGNAGLWGNIYNANAGLIADPNLIYPGQVFSIPQAPPVGTVVLPTTTPGSQTGQGLGQYTVRAGDSLWSIAQYAYGDPLRWSDIYNRNATVIGADPSLIFAGTVLSMP